MTGTAEHRWEAVWVHDGHGTPIWGDGETAQEAAEDAIQAGHDHARALQGDPYSDGCDMEGFCAYVRCYRNPAWTRILAGLGGSVLASWDEQVDFQVVLVDGSYQVAP